MPAFQQMKIVKERLHPFKSPLVSFTGDKIYPKEVVTLTIIARTYPAQISKEIDFLVVDFLSTDNWTTNFESSKSSHSNILLEGEVPNGLWSGENTRRSSSC